MFVQGPSQETLNGRRSWGRMLAGAIDTLDYSSSPAAIFLLLETSTGRGFGGWAQG